MGDGTESSTESSASSLNEGSERDFDCDVCGKREDGPGVASVGVPAPKQKCSVFSVPEQQHYEVEAPEQPAQSVPLHHLANA